MKKLWIIPILIILILSGFWYFRWEKGPTISEKGLKIENKKDRWFNQYWTVTYGVKDGELLSGVEDPFISKLQIKHKYMELTKTEEFKDIPLLTDKIDKTKQKIRLINPNHTKFMNKALDAEFKRELKEPESKSKIYIKTPYDFAWETDIGDWDKDLRWSTGEMPQLPTKGEVANLIKANVPQSLINAENEYRKCFKVLADARAKRDVLAKKAEDKAKKILIDNAFKSKNLATNLSIGTFIICIIVTLLLFFWGYRKPQDKKFTN